MRRAYHTKAAASSQVEISGSPEQRFVPEDFEKRYQISSFHLKEISQIVRVAAMKVGAKYLGSLRLAVLEAIPADLQEKKITQEEVGKVRKKVSEAQERIREEVVSLSGTTEQIRDYSYTNMNNPGHYIGRVRKALTE